VIRRENPTPARAGMTLIELLVVMLIIATLASLIFSAVFTVRDAKMKNFTESLVNKLASATEQQWNAATDQIREEPVPNWALSMANGDPRIAKVLYLKARLKQEFPASFYQAVYPNANFGPNAGTPVNYMTAGGSADLPPKATYLKALTPLIGTPLIPAVGSGVPVPQDFESSAMLYMALSQGRRGQTGFNPDDNVEATAIQTRTVGGVTFKIFVDSWGNPIRFWNCPYRNDELNLPPYVQNVNATSTVSTLQNQQSPDPQDPDQALAAFQSTAFTKMVHPVGGPLRMLIPVIGSIGRDGQIGVDPFDMNPDGTAGSNDNIYSYRLRQFGRRGD
jgi:prepilin-type N-terminal cleavage/methylation domain-containing protein